MLTKINYQKELDKLIDHLQKEEKVPTLSSSQLLCSVQQLCTGVSEQLF